MCALIEPLYVGVMNKYSETFSFLPSEYFLCSAPLEEGLYHSHVIVVIWLILPVVIHLS